MSAAHERDLAGEATEREAYLERLRADISDDEAAEEAQLRDDEAQLRDDEDWEPSFHDRVLAARKRLYA